MGQVEFTYVIVYSGIVNPDVNSTCPIFGTGSYLILKVLPLIITIITTN